MNIITHECCTAHLSPGHPERPARVSRTLERLKHQKDLSIDWETPKPVDDNLLVRAHPDGHVEKVKEALHFDGDTPAYPDIYDHACRSVGGGLRALELARQGEMVFSLLRPPGHHATRDQAMGFCYFNSIALTVLHALETGAKKVAVYDFDVHHGNGTEAILREHPQAVFFSIHQHPCYPGTGTKHVGNNCFNYPVPPHTPRDEYRHVLSRALDDLKSYRPDLVAVSAGFDAYAEDPLAQETLLAEDFFWLGQSLRGLELPVCSILEGGYSDDLPELILAYLKGLNQI
jgi:acetoin utilization deacetylase AcuC-like enzyme